MQLIRQNKLAGLIPIFVITVLGFFAYFNSLKGEFILDDKALIEQNIYIKNRPNIKNIFTEDLGAGASCRYHFYRPLQLFSYLIDFSFWRLNVVGYHLMNILLNILIGFCIYLIVRFIFNEKSLALITSSLFVVHPVHTQVVSYISSRSDLLFSLFMLLSFIFYIKQQQKSNLIFYCCMLISYVLSFLSKENAFVFPLILILYHFIFQNKIKLRLFFSIIFITIAYALFRIIFLKEILYTNPHTTTFLKRLPGFFVAVFNYLKILILPRNLHMEYGNAVFNFNDYRAILGFIIMVFLLAYAFKKRNSNKLISFSILWFFIGLLPVSNLYPLNAYMAENWIYLPSLGFCLMVANFLNFLYNKNKLKLIAVAVTVVIILSYLYLTLRQNKFWQDNLSFYQNTLKYAPNSSRAYNNLANIYLEKGDNEEAIRLFEKAISLEPYFAASYCGLGNAYKNLGQSDKAIMCYETAIRLKPNYEYAYNVLGLFYASLGKFDEAAAYYKKAIELNPNYKDAYNNLKKIEETSRGILIK